MVTSKCPETETTSVVLSARQAILWFKNAIMQAFDESFFSICNSIRVVNVLMYFAHCFPGFPPCRSEIAKLVSFQLRSFSILNFKGLVFTRALC